MLLKINIQPCKIEAFSKSELLSKLQRSGLCWSGGDFGYGLSSFIKNSCDTVRVFNCEKHNRKFKTVIDKKKIAKGIKKERVCEAKWVAYYYDFPIELLKIAGLQVHQGVRTFKISQKWK